MILRIAHGVILLYIFGMTRNQAKNQLGGTLKAMAAQCGISLSAVKKWPTTGPLTRQQLDTVQAAIYRKIKKVMP